MALTDKDVAKIRLALKPDFDNLATKLDIRNSEKNIKTEIKKYIHEGVDSVVDGVDLLLKDQQYDSRLKKLERIHPDNHHLVD